LSGWSLIAVMCIGQVAKSTMHVLQDMRVGGVVAMVW